MNRVYCVHLHSSNAYLSEFKDETNGPVFEIIDSQDRAIYLTIDQYADLVRYHPLYKELVERVKTNAANGDARMKAEQQVRDLEMNTETALAHLEAFIAGGDELGDVPEDDAIEALQSIRETLEKQEKEIERLRAVLDRTQDTLEYTKRKERK
jgi:hypothetical protein